MSVSIKDKTTGEWVQVAGGTMYADSPIGSIIPYGGTTAPDGFLFCQGQAVSRTTYAELFKVIGTAFGAGDGSTTFNVPDLRGKVPVGLSSSDTEFNTLGKTGGEKTHKLVISEMPSHTHLTGISPNTAFDIELKNSGASAEVTWLQNKSNTSPTGGDGAHNNIQPYNTVNYIIKAKQVSAPADFMDAVDEAVETELEIKNITLTKVNVASNSSIMAKKSGSVVNVNFSALLTLNQTTSAGTILVSGFPKPVFDGVRFGLYDVSVMDLNTGLVQINSNGNLVADGQGLKPGTAYWGSFTYLTNE